MVKIKHELLDKAIIRTQRRIALAEKHGIGQMAIKEKQILVMQKKTRAERKTN